MASFPHVIDRVKKWDVEVKETRKFVETLENIEGINQLGKKPKEHDLVRFETPIFDEIAKHHTRRGFFLYEELKKRKIVGIKRGQTKWFKCSVYGFSAEQKEYIAETFVDIASKDY